MNFIYRRRIYFSETDAAGVVYFANFLSLCHEAYEEALRNAGIELNQLFKDKKLVIPIVHSECDYFRPLECGDEIEIEVIPQIKTPDSFTITYDLYRLTPNRKRSARARTDHVCIDSDNRKRHPLPQEFQQFIQMPPEM